MMQRLQHAQGHTAAITQMNKASPMTTRTDRDDVCTRSACIAIALP